MEQLQKASIVATYSDGSHGDHRRPVQSDRVHARQGRADRRDRDPGSRLAAAAVRPRPEREAHVDLFFDTTEDGTGAGATSVTTHTDQIYSLVKIEPAGHAPPICTFIWNAKFPGADLPPAAGQPAAERFHCVVESVKQKFTFFSPEGVPLRATLTLTLREYKTLDEQLDAAQSELARPHPQPRDQRQATRSPALRRRYYRRAGEWRAIAAGQRHRRSAPARRRAVPARAADPVSRMSDPDAVGRIASASTASTCRSSRCASRASVCRATSCATSSQVTYNDSIKEIDSFELTVNNWDADDPAIQVRRRRDAGRPEGIDERQRALPAVRSVQQAGRALDGLCRRPRA